MKILFFIPAILFVIFYGFVAMSIGISSISPICFAWIALFLGGGVLLSKGKSLGGFLGLLPGIHLIYMSTKDTGQVINIEKPLGITILIFYIFCSGLVFYIKRRKKEYFQKSNQQ